MPAGFAAYYMRIAARSASTFGFSAGLSASCLGSLVRPVLPGAVLKGIRSGGFHPLRTAPLAGPSFLASSHRLPHEGESFVRAVSTSSKMSASELDEVQMGYMHGENCILLNDKDEVIGHDTKLNCHLLDHKSFQTPHRAFSVFLFNSKNELLLQQRSHTKVTFPLVWTNTCCSHPLHTEAELEQAGSVGVRRASVRKLDNELGIKPEDCPVDGFTVMGRIHYKAPCEGLLNGQGWGEHEIDYILMMKRDVECVPNPEEVEAVRYVDKAGLKQLLADADAGEVKLSPWFRLIVDNFLWAWWDRLEQGALEEAIDMETIHKMT